MSKIKRLTQSYSKYISVPWRDDEAWRYPDASGKPLGVREIPAPNIACCGLKVAAKAQDWEALVPDEAPNAEYVRQELRQLHASFALAPILGSLLDPARSLKQDLASSDIETLEQLLNKALTVEANGHDSSESWDIALSARGLLDAARLLSKRYHFCITNVPYLGLRRMSAKLQELVSDRYPDSKADLATAMLERIFELLHVSGTVGSVSPQNWLYQPAYENFRKLVLEKKLFLNLTVLGEGGFASSQAAGAFVSMTLLSNQPPVPGSQLSFLDASILKGPIEKAELIRNENIRMLPQNRASPRVFKPCAPVMQPVLKTAHSANGWPTAAFLEGTGAVHSSISQPVRPIGMQA